jgi:hypothetical protein
VTTPPKGEPLQNFNPQTLWFAVVLFGASAYAIYHGGRIVLRREIETLVFEVRGGKALAIGLAILALGVIGVVVAAREGLRLRG